MTGDTTTTTTKEKRKKESRQCSGIFEPGSSRLVQPSSPAPLPPPPPSSSSPQHPSSPLRPRSAAPTTRCRLRLPTLAPADPRSAPPQVPAHLPQRLLQSALHLLHELPALLDVPVRPPAPHRDVVVAHAPAAQHMGWGRGFAPVSTPAGPGRAHRAESQRRRGKSAKRRPPAPPAPAELDHRPVLVHPKGVRERRAVRADEHVRPPRRLELLQRAQRPAARRRRRRRRRAMRNASARLAARGGRARGQAGAGERARGGFCVRTRSPPSRTRTRAWRRAAR